MLVLHYGITNVSAKSALIVGAMFNVVLPLATYKTR